MPQLLYALEDHFEAMAQDGRSKLATRAYAAISMLCAVAGDALHVASQRLSIR